MACSTINLPQIPKSDSHSDTAHELEVQPLFPQKDVYRKDRHSTQVFAEPNQGAA